MTVMLTARLRLRAWTAGDIDALATLFADPDVSRYPFGRGLTREETQPFLDRQIERWEADGFCMWAAEPRDEPRLVGYVGLGVPVWLPEVMPSVEAGWRLHPAYWGRGLATEGAQAVLAYAFDVLGLDRVVSIFVPENVASGRVMEKLGMWHLLTTTDPQFGVPLEVREITAAAWRRGGRP